MSDALEVLDQRVDAAEGEGLRARWEFGLEAISQKTNINKWAQDRDKERSEYAHRVRFARAFPTEEEFVNAVHTWPSWSQILKEGLRTEQASTTTPPLPKGDYRCIVIDPPWPVQKIIREVRPNQTEALDYPTMPVEKIDELCGKVLKAHTSTHVYLWTTHRFLPDAFELFKSWDVNYECLMSWVKNVGPTPFSWMYDTEHVLFGRRGSLPLLRNGLRLSFSAKATGHSIKPEIFYERVCEASPGPRLAMFERTQREGFEVWGDELAA